MSTGEEPGGAGVFAGVSREFTELTELKRELELTVRQLEGAHLELERFAFITSHHLDEPLRQISSFSGLLAKRYSGYVDENTEDYVNYVLSGVQLMQALIRDLGLYYRIITDKHVAVEIDLEALVNRIIHDMDATITRTKTKIQCDPLPTVWGIGRHLEIVFVNLLDNAIKFSTAEKPQVHISAQKKKGYWEIAIKDNGLGIEEHYFGRIFDVFQKLHSKEEYSGTGMGLSVSRKIVEKINGRIWVESEPGVGSIFYLAFPIRKSAGLNPKLKS